MENVFLAVDLLFDFNVAIAILAGVIFGMIMGVLPGLGSILAITIALPFTFAMDPVPSIALVLAIYCSSVYGGSVSAILINTPGTPQSAATMLDGYPMTLRGEASEALGWATVASLFGGLVSIVVLVIAAPQLARIALQFGPIETFSLICMALTCIAAVSTGTMLKGLMAGIIGIFLSLIGTDPMTGVPRFDFGFFQLSGGLGLVPVLVGLFALAEVLSRMSSGKTVPIQVNEKIGLGIKIAPLSEWLLRKGTLIKSSLIGTFIGILPGTGAATASFVAYAEAKRSGKFKENFGKGEPEGIIASESSNNAVTGGALVPTLALGIPGDPSTAVLMSVLIIQGIQPGARLFVDSGDLMMAVFLALLICNLVMFVIGFYGSRFATKVLSMPEGMLLAMVTVMSLVGAYGVNGRTFDVFVALGAGVFGLFLRYCSVPVAPVIIGFVLGASLEESLRQGLILNDGNFLSFFHFNNPIALVLIIMTISLIILAGWREWTLTRQLKMDAKPNGE